MVELQDFRKKLDCWSEDVRPIVKTMLDLDLYIKDLEALIKDKKKIKELKAKYGLK